MANKRPKKIKLGLGELSITVCGSKCKYPMGTIVISSLVKPAKARVGDDLRDVEDLEKEELVVIEGSLEGFEVLETQLRKGMLRTAKRELQEWVLQREKEDPGHAEREGYILPTQE